MKFGHVIEYKKGNIVLQKSWRICGGETKKIKKRKFYTRYKQVICSLISICLRTIKTNCIELYIIDPKTCSILIF